MKFINAKARIDSSSEEGRERWTENQCQMAVYNDWRYNDINHPIITDWIAHLFDDLTPLELSNLLLDGIQFNQSGSCDKAISIVARPLISFAENMADEIEAAYRLSAEDEEYNRQLDDGEI